MLRCAVFSKSRLRAGTRHAELDFSTFPSLINQARELGGDFGNTGDLTTLRGLNDQSEEFPGWLILAYEAGPWNIGSSYSGRELLKRTEKAVEAIMSGSGPTPLDPEKFINPGDLSALRAQTDESYDTETDNYVFNAIRTGGAPINDCQCGTCVRARELLARGVAEAGIGRIPRAGVANVAPADTSSVVVTVSATTGTTASTGRARTAPARRERDTAGRFISKER